MDSSNGKKNWTREEGGCPHTVSYENTDRLRRETAFHTPGGMTPDDVAAVIVKAATVKNPKPIFTAGAKYKIFVVLFKLLPYRLAYWIVGKMYS